MRTSAPVAALVLALQTILGCSQGPSSTTSAANAIVGGSAEAGWLAAGYLTFAPTAGALNPGQIACGGALIAPNVVMTAAHCVLAQPQATWAFGTGAPGSSSLVTIAEIHVHPQYDASNPLRNYDLAYLILSGNVAGVTPAALPTAAPALGCDAYEAIAYDAQGNHVGASACIDLEPTLGSDPILEIHPSGGTAICVGNGDYGSALVDNGSSGPVLVGLFVGSVTQPLTDCVTGAQFLDGYESAYGFSDFFQQAINAGNGSASGDGSAADAAADAGFDAAPDAGVGP